jgi:hypothetical protein
MEESVMRGFKRYLVPALMVLSLGFLAGSDSECEIEGLPDINIVGWGHHEYDDEVVVFEDYYYDPYWW